MQLDGSIISDIFTLSGAATPAQDEPDNGITQMEPADIKSELNILLTIDDRSPSSVMVTEPSAVNPEPQATALKQDPEGNPPGERGREAEPNASLTN